LPCPWVALAITAVIPLGLVVLSLARLDPKLGTARKA
jgi:hypothetical protein